MQDELNGQHRPRKGKYLVKYKQKIITYSDIFRSQYTFSFSLQLANFKRGGRGVKKSIPKKCGLGHLN